MIKTRQFSYKAKGEAGPLKWLAGYASRSFAGSGTFASRRSHSFNHYIIIHSMITIIIHQYIFIVIYCTIIVSACKTMCENDWWIDKCIYCTSIQQRYHISGRWGCGCQHPEWNLSRIPINPCKLSGYANSYDDLEVPIPRSPGSWEWRYMIQRTRNCKREWLIALIRISCHSDIFRFIWIMQDWL